MAGVAVVVVLGAAGCAAAPTATPEPSSSANEIAIGALAAGRYTNSDFTPRIEVEVPAGWLTYHLSPDFFDVAVETEDGPVAVMFLRPIEILAPSGDRVVSDPARVIALLAEHPGVTVSEPRAVEIDGLPGLEVEASFGRDNTHVMRVSEGDIGFGPQNDIRLTNIGTDEGLLVIGLNAPAGNLAEAERLTEEVRASIHIGD
jgi:hypothetical protein